MNVTIVIVKAVEGHGDICCGKCRSYLQMAVRVSVRVCAERDCVCPAMMAGWGGAILSSFEILLSVLATRTRLISSPPSGLSQMGPSLGDFPER